MTVFKSFILRSIGIGTLVGAGFSLINISKTSSQIQILNGETIIPSLNKPINIQPSRKVRIPSDVTGLKLTLYQYQTCPFCCKVRVFLDYYGISYDVVEVDPVLRQSIQWSQYKKVPILLAELNDGCQQQLNDSTMIISALSSLLADNAKSLPEIMKYYPILKSNDPKGTIKTDIMNKYFIMTNAAIVNEQNNADLTEERKWRTWADNVLVHTLSPNVYRSQTEALQAFNWFSEVGEWEKHFPTWERLLIIYVGAFAMWLIGKRLKKRYNLKDDVRQSLYDECNYWIRAIRKKGTPFMGGVRPNLSDLAVYGVLSSIEGCNTFQDMLLHSSISEWYKAMKDLVQKHEGMKYI
ncbi:Suppressor of ref(2)P sterility [Carabus blaptoides fortunei]